MQGWVGDAKDFQFYPKNEKDNEDFMHRCDMVRFNVLKISL